MKKTVPYIKNLKNNRVVSMMTAYDTHLRKQFLTLKSILF